MNGKRKFYKWNCGCIWEYIGINANGQHKWLQMINCPSDTMGEGVTCVGISPEEYKSNPNSSIVEVDRVEMSVLKLLGKLNNEIV